MNYRVNLIIGIIVTIHSVLFSQGLSSTTEFPLQSEYYGNSQAALCSQSDGSLRIFWADRLSLPDQYSIKTAVSTDNGVSWTDENTLLVESIRIKGLTALQTSSGRILLSFGLEDTIRFIYSDTNGNDWKNADSALVSFFLDTPQDLIETDDGTLVLIASNYQQSFYFISDDSGNTWQESREIELLSRISRKTMGRICASIQIGSSTYFVGNVESYRISLTEYDIKGDSALGYWSDIETNINAVSIELIKTDSNIVLLYSKYEDTGVPLNFSTNDKFITGNVYYRVSNDSMKSWSEERKFTSAISRDRLSDAAATPDGIFTVFNRKSNSRSNLWMGYADNSTDQSPPLILDHGFVREDYTLNDTLVLRVIAVDETSVEQAGVVIFEDSTEMQTYTMYDDGTNGDKTADDNIWTASLFSPEKDKGYSYIITVRDADGNSDSVFFEGYYFFNDYREKYIVNINNLMIPINNRGIIADVIVDTHTGGAFYNGEMFLFSGGFYLSGLAADSIWTFGMAGAERDEHCQPGPVGSMPEDSRNRIYVVSFDDEPFGTAWQEWKYAVEQGAEYIDGDLDSVYNPVDKNGNGRWDTNEDRPDILGDMTAFCVYNDGIAPELRDGFNNQIPRGIEIRQTLYGFDSQNPELANSIFIRYEIVNTGTVAFQYDSVYFSFWNDADLGDYLDDLTGCDTILNTGFVYNDGSDEKYGDNPPALFTAFHNKLPGVESGADTTDLLSSFINKLQSQSLPLPHDAETVRNQLTGHLWNGNEVDPCTWEYGTVYNEDCADVNPFYWYSGNPIDRTGWVNTLNDDYRILNNSGPFELNTGEPVEIIVSYTIGNGTDPLNSISVGKKYLADLKGIPWVGLEDNNKSSVIPSDFALSQNYPNPFNPVTTINYQLPAAGKVTLKVYNILGQEVKTLVNDVQEAGYKTVEFDASKYASGVYIYRISVESTGGSNTFSESKKMIYLK